MPRLYFVKQPVASETPRIPNWWFTFPQSWEYEVENPCEEAPFVPLLWVNGALKSFSQDTEHVLGLKWSSLNITYFTSVSWLISTQWSTLPFEHASKYDELPLWLHFWEGSPCLKGSCYRVAKHPISHTYVVFAVNLSSCMAWMSTLTSCVV